MWSDTTKSKIIVTIIRSKLNIFCLNNINQDSGINYFHHDERMEPKADKAPSSYAWRNKAHREPQVTLEGSNCLIKKRKESKGL
jgi:hypothetical protein